jgi:ring-1,2-phenylacetyl-CoA epoxidase subunit PaaC
MTASIAIQRPPKLHHDVHYVLRLADTCLIASHRLSEWAGHAPVLEEDIALANMALDQLGQARALLTLAGQAHGEHHGLAFDEDQLAFLRDERDYFNVTLAELPHSDSGASGGASMPGDFAFTVLRNHALATWWQGMWGQLASTSSHAQLAAIAAKALKEVRYHEQHAADWVVRLGDGTDDSAQRMQAALKRMVPYVAELFVDDDVDASAVKGRLGPAWSSMRQPWMQAMRDVYAQAQLPWPSAWDAGDDAAAPKRFVSRGRIGQHSEHMGYILSTMQQLQRSHPGGVW